MRFLKYFGKNSLAWDAAAEEALKKVPAPVRPLVRAKVEKTVREQGKDREDMKDFQAAEQRWKGMLSGSGAAGMEKAMPRPNEPGASLAVLETCHALAVECRNQLLDVEVWKDALERWVKEKDVSERLRRRIASDVIFSHHKLKISISGCPNGCSRPQIADIAVVGCARPEFDLKSCTGCGECETACPDAAIALEDGVPVWNQDLCQGCVRCHQACPSGCIRLTNNGGRLLAGGKLGRHPRLAEALGAFRTPKELVARVDGMFSDHLEHGRGQERFADFWHRWNRRGV